ncbi:hypothetical protein WJU16_07090 [Chitinophaga pollutisoli]|uniref:Uncharacterized protein n=1 Tax=Chitinophaga pollutisoli TaxID=3133966 RepID=A0ABZ2YTK2_9BACT
MKLFTQCTANRRLYQLLLIMKMSLVLTCLFLQVHAGVYSQKRISVRAEKLPVSQVLSMIELKTSYRFFITATISANSRRYRSTFPTARCRK